MFKASLPLDWCEGAIGIFSSTIILMLSTVYVAEDRMLELTAITFASLGAMVGFSGHAAFGHYDFFEEESCDLLDFFMG